MATKQFNRLDADETAFFERELDYVKAQSYDEKMAPLEYARFIPVSSEAPAAATTITWTSYTSYGMAQFIASYAKDFPRSDIVGKENTIKVFSLGNSYGWNIQEIRQSQMANKRLDVRRINATRRGMEEKIDQIAWNGDADHGINGFIKYPGTTEYTVPADGTGTTKTWSTKTPDQILRDLNGLKNAVFIGTNGVEQINTILIPMEQMDLIKNTRVGTTSDTTIYEFFVRNNPGIMIEGTRYMKGAGTGGIDVMIGYNRSPDYLTFELPLPFEQTEMEKEGLEYKVPCHARVAGTIIYYPSSVAWSEGI